MAVTVYGTVAPSSDVAVVVMSSGRCSVGAVVSAGRDGGGGGSEGGAVDGTEPMSSVCVALSFALTGSGVVPLTRAEFVTVCTAEPLATVTVIVKLTVAQAPAIRRCR